MKYKLEINLGNAAFHPDPEPELQRILRKIAEQLGDRSLEDRFIYDVNGNKVGEVKVVKTRKQ
jgi:hypothetical protein